MRFTTNAISHTLGKKVLALVVITLITIVSVGSSSPFSVVVYAQQQQRVQLQQCITPPAGLVNWWPGD